MTETKPYFAPISPSERIFSLDVLCGFATKILIQ